MHDSSIPRQDHCDLVATSSEWRVKSLQLEFRGANLIDKVVSSHGIQPLPVPCHDNADTPGFVRSEQLWQEVEDELPLAALEVDIGEVDRADL